MKFGKQIRLYAVVTQGLFSILVLTAGGFFIGWLINKENVFLSGLLAIIGAICGIILFIYQVLKESKNNENNKRQ